MGIGVHWRVNFVVLARLSEHNQAKLVILVKIQGERKNKAGLTAAYPFKVLLDHRKGSSIGLEIRLAKCVRRKPVFCCPVSKRQFFWPGC